MPEIRALSPDLVQKAQDTLGESPQRLSEDINALRCWIAKQPHLIARTDDQFLVTFLRCCKFSLEESKTKLESYFTSKTIYPELLKYRPINSSLLDLVRCGLYVIPSNPIPSGSKLFISRFGNYDTKKQFFLDVFKVQLMMYELLALEDDWASVNGIEHVYDLKNCTLQHVMHCNPVILKKVYIFQERAAPVRIVRAHLINLKKELHGAFKFVMSILPSEMPFEVILHEEEEDLFKYIPQDCFTSEYGGSNGNITGIVMDWEKNLQDHTEYFENDSKYGTNEKLRQGPITNLQTDFGIEGSFRKLEVD